MQYCRLTSQLGKHRMKSFIQKRTVCIQLYHVMSHYHKFFFDLQLVAAAEGPGAQLHHLSLPCCQAPSDRNDLKPSLHSEVALAGPTLTVACCCSTSYSSSSESNVSARRCGHTTPQHVSMHISTRLPAHCNQFLPHAGACACGSRCLGSRSKGGLTLTCWQERILLHLSR
jgi:hypothetical protein